MELFNELEKLMQEALKEAMGESKPVSFYLSAAASLPEGLNPLSALSYFSQISGVLIETGLYSFEDTTGYMLPLFDFFSEASRTNITGDEFTKRITEICLRKAYQGVGQSAEEVVRFRAMLEEAEDDLNNPAKNKFMLPLSDKICTEILTDIGQLSEIEKNTK